VTEDTPASYRREARDAHPPLDHEARRTAAIAPAQATALVERELAVHRARSGR
jgi:hypothetical protein